MKGRPIGQTLSMLGFSIERLLLLLWMPIMHSEYFVCGRHSSKHLCVLSHLIFPASMRQALLLCSSCS